MTLSPARENALGCAALSAFVSLAAFAGLQLWAAALAGVFEYPLDDVYIHMAMAEGIASGTYGVNPGEASSAASSILYPLLLVPFAGTEMQRWMPLLWNIVGVAAVGVLWGLVVSRANLSRVVTVVLAIVGPLALNVPGVGFAGMEHSLHAAFALACLLGLWIFVKEDRISALLVIGVIGAPLMRLEGLALSGAACGVLLLRGRIAAAFGLGLAAILPVLAFMGFLVSLGLEPLPGSIIAKTQLSTGNGPELPGFVRAIIENIQKKPGQILLALSFFSVLIALAVQNLRRERLYLVFWAIGLAGIAHFLGGRIGWMNRYEHYILLVLIGGLVLALSHMGPVWRGVTAAALVLSLGVLGDTYATSLADRSVWGPRAIHLQQAQMARFAKDYAQAPVGVNDLGWVTWQNDQYVFDLYGLGSPSALAERMRPGGPQPGWGGPLVAQHGVRLVMIYDSWFADAVAPTWQRLGELTMDNPRGTVADWRVGFYATAPEYAPELREKLRAFAQTLPADAQFTMAEVGQ